MTIFNFSPYTYDSAVHLINSTQQINTFFTEIKCSLNLTEPATPIILQKKVYRSHFAECPAVFIYLNIIISFPEMQSFIKTY